MRYLITLLLFVCSNVFADLYYDTYQGTGATPSFPGNGGSLTYPTVLSSGTVSSLALDWGSGYVLDSGRNERVIAHFYGKIYIPSAGTYTFYYSGDDGMYMKIDGGVVISDWQEQGRSYYNGSGSKYFASAGYYDIDTWWYENGGGASIYLYWNYGGSINLISSTYYSLTGPTTTTTTGTSTGPTSTQATIKSSAQTRRDSYSGDDNGIYIDQAGSNNSITILQDSDNNQIRGIDQQRAKMWGNSNIYDIRQGAPTTTGINLIELMVDGNSNDLELFQDRFNDGTADSSASGDNILRIDIDGNSNTVATNQRGETNAGGQFGEIIITGDSNTVDLMQRSTLGETAFIDITGDSNVVDLLQQNTSNAVGSSKFADIKLTGDGHTVNLTQDGTGGHQATIDLTYGSAPSTLDLDQLGSTSQSFSIEQTCYTAGGCSTSVTQQ